MLIRRAIDPRRANYEKFAGTYDTVVNGALTVLVAIHLIVLGKALGLPIPLERTTPVLVGICWMLGAMVLPVIENIVTHPDYRRTGLARQVLQAVVNECRKRSCYKIMLMSSVERSDAHALYEATGFDSTAKRAFVLRTL